MNVVVFSTSAALRKHLVSVFQGNVPLLFREQLILPAEHNEGVYLVHAGSFSREMIEAVLKLKVDGKLPLAVVENVPSVTSMLSYTQLGARAYCNAFMAPEYYQQLVSLLAQGMSWFPPSLLNDAFSLAQKSLAGGVNEADLAILTPREKEVALNVAQGKSNKVIAEECAITERTVKAHLSKVYKKLRLKDRVELALYFNQ